MHGKHLLLSLIVTLFLVIGVRANEIQKVSPDSTGMDMLTYPPTFEYADIKPVIINDDPQTGSALLVPEGSTVSMMLFGFSVLGAVAWFRKSRKA